MLYPIPHPQDERWLFQSDGCARLPSTPSIKHQSHVLTLDTLRVHPFIPVFNEYLSMFTNTLRHLDIRNAYGIEQQLLYIMRQFPLSDDLSIVYPVKVATCWLHAPSTLFQILRRHTRAGSLRASQRSPVDSTFVHWNCSGVGAHKIS